MKEPTVSLAMTTYNGERFIGEQLESFARQERLPDELVVSDDGSTDRTLEIVRKFAASAPFSVRVFANETRLGIARNFERAIEEADGDIIFLSDSDDYWYPQKINAMVKALEEAPHAGLAVCNSDQVDERLQPLGMRTWESVDRFTPTRRLLRAIALGKTYSRRMPAGGSCMAFRAKFKPLILPLPDGGKFQRTGYDHFIAWAIICSGAGGAVLLTEPLLAYRQHTGQATHKRPDPFYSRALRRVAARHEDPHLLTFLLSRVESDCAARSCRNCRIRSDVIRHLRARLNMPSSFGGRLPLVARELVTLRYHRFSSGLLPAAKDLLFARKPGSEENKLTGTCHGQAAES